MVVVVEVVELVVVAGIEVVVEVVEEVVDVVELVVEVMDVVTGAGLMLRVTGII